MAIVKTSRRPCLGGKYMATVHIDDSAYAGVSEEEKERRRNVTRNIAEEILLARELAAMDKA